MCEIENVKGCGILNVNTESTVVSVKLSEMEREKLAPAVIGQPRSSVSHNPQELISNKYSLIDSYFFTNESNHLQVSPSPVGELIEKGYLQYSEEVFDLNDVGILALTKSNTSPLGTKYILPAVNLPKLKELEDISPGWLFVGDGIAYDHCASWFAKGCDNVENHVSGKDLVQTMQRFCYRGLCFVCENLHKKWSSHQAAVITHRMLCYVLRKCIRDVDLEGHELKSKFVFPRINEIYSELDFEKRYRLIDEAFRITRRGDRPIHCSLTFDPKHQNNYFRKTPKELRKIAVKVAKKLGMRGFVTIFHPGRMIDRKKGWIDENFVYSPHFHFVGFGWIDGAKEISEIEGINFYNHGIRDSVFQTLKYEFSHCAIKSGSKTYSYYGCLHHSHLGKTPKMPRYNSRCPILTCLEFLRKCIWVGEGDCPIQDLIGTWLFVPGSWKFYDAELRNWTSP